MAKADRANANFLWDARNSSNSLAFPPFALAVARADNKRAMKPRASKKKRGK